MHGVLGGGTRRAFGSDTVPNTYEDLDAADLIILVGSNAAWCHPVLFQRMQAARDSRGAVVVNIDPRRTATSEGADLQLSLKPGSDSALFAWLLVQIDGARRDGPRLCFDACLRGGARRRGGAPHRARSRDSRGEDGAGGRRHRPFVELFIARERVVTCYSQGVNQSAQGSDKVNAILNCHWRRAASASRLRAALADRAAERHGRARGRRARQHAGGAHELLRAGGGARAALLGRAEHGDGGGLQGRPDVRGHRARRDQGAVGDAHQPCGEPPARRRHARGDAQAGAVRRLRGAGRDRHHGRRRPCAAAGTAWGEKDGTVTNSERRISRQRAFLPAPARRSPTGSMSRWWRGA